MVNITINNKKVQVEEGLTILQAARKVGIKIPTLCFLKDINDIGACRVCCVELRGNERLVAACNTVAEEGMDILTNSPKTQAVRKMNLEAILSQHDFRCATCVRSGNCKLQELCRDFNIDTLPFTQEYEPFRWNEDFPLIRDASKCIKCMRCVQVCDKIQSLNIWDVVNTGKRTGVDVSKSRSIEEADCALCGQCITHCPVAALKERDDTQKFMDAVNDPDKIVVVQVAPAVRTAWAELFGLDREFATEKRMAAAIRALGGDYVFDTVFSADLTIMEEGSELLERLSHKEDYKWPMFTSCCPGWVRFLKSQYPEMTSQLSTAKSPQQMFGVVAKTYFAEKVLKENPDKIFSVSIMPCVAKKAEAAYDCIDDSTADKDVDLVLTTRELDRLLRMNLIDVELLEEEEFDSPLGAGTGAGVIFGATGGVMEAALRSAYYLVEGRNPDADLFKAVRGMKDVRTAEVTLGGQTIRAAVVSGLGNTRKLMRKIRNGEEKFDFVEVMACPGGCSGGGGQPIHDCKELAEERGQVLYKIDKDNPLRFSHENPEVIKLYNNYLGKPLSEKAHHLLHTDHEAWKMPR